MFSYCYEISPDYNKDDDVFASDCHLCFIAQPYQSPFKYRTSNEIRFNTSDRSCTEIDNGEYWDVWSRLSDCNDSWLASYGYDACENCLRGDQGQIWPIDGYDDGSILFRAVDNDRTECVILNTNWLSCNSGWYGGGDSLWFNDDNQSWYGCSKCPDGGTSDILLGRETDITACYIPSGTILSDTTGKYIFDQDCHYTK